MNKCRQTLQVPCAKDGEGAKEGGRVGRGFIGEVKSAPCTPGRQGWVLFHTQRLRTCIWSQTELCDPGQVT